MSSTLCYFESFFLIRFDIFRFSHTNVLGIIIEEEKTSDKSDLFSILNLFFKLFALHCLGGLLIHLVIEMLPLLNYSKRCLEGEQLYTHILRSWKVVKCDCSLNNRFGIFMSFAFVSLSQESAP